MFKNWKKEAKEWKGAAVALNKALEISIKKERLTDEVLDGLLEEVAHLLEKMDDDDMNKYAEQTKVLEKYLELNYYPYVYFVSADKDE